MSILDNNPNSHMPDVKMIASHLKNTTKLTFQNMVQSFNNGSKAFWQNPKFTPEEIAKELGTDAKEIFELHYKLGQLISTIKPDTITEGLSAIGQFVINDDGTVIILPSSGVL